MSEYTVKTSVHQWLKGAITTKFWFYLSCLMLVSITFAQNASGYTKLATEVATIDDYVR